MKRNPQQVRQGDVLLVPVTLIPPEAQPVPREAGSTVLAHGEVTGHSHVINHKAAKLFAIPGTVEPRRFLRAGRDVVLRHEEHRPIRIARGEYEVIIQREYDGGETRQVVD